MRELCEHKNLGTLSRFYDCKLFWFAPCSRYNFPIMVKPNFLKKLTEETKSSWLLCIACIIAYAQVLPYKPVYDDVEFIANNPIAHDALAVFKIFSESYIGRLRADILYRPLSVWSFALNRGFNSALGLDPMNPVLFHLVNLVLHCVVTCLLYRLLRLLGQNWRVSLGASLFFAVLPIHTEAVTGIVGRAELLAAFFGLLFIIGHLSKWNLYLTCGFYLLGMFAKESGLNFLAILLLINFLFYRETLKDRRYYFYAGTAALWLAIRFMVIRGLPYHIPFVDNPISVVNLAWRFFTASKYQIEYLLRILTGLWLTSDYSYNQVPIVTKFYDPYFLSFLLVSTLAIRFAWKARRSEPILLFLLGFYAVGFATTSNFLRAIGSSMAERFTYTPSIAICALLAYFIEKWLPNKKAYAGVVLILTAIYSVLTIQRNLSWKDEVSFFSMQAESSPKSAKAHYNYGTTLAKFGHREEAVAEYEKALQIFPYYPEVYFNLGNSLREIGAPTEKVIAAYRNAYKYDAGNQKAMGNLLLYFVGLGRTQDALEVARSLAQINPNHPALLSLSK